MPEDFTFRYFIYVFSPLNKVLGGELDLCVDEEDIFRHKSFHSFSTEFTDETSGETKVLLASDFGRTGARAAFPCMDEPDIRTRCAIIVAFPR